MTSENSIARVPVALTIAGLDPSGGAGIIADVRTFAAFGCFATAAITSLTFQNTTGVFGAIHLSAANVRAQVIPILEDFTVAAAKTGMLPTAEVILEVARLFRAKTLPRPVVDPVMRATSGDDLIDNDAVDCLVRELLPLARVVTPNIPEAERLTGTRITNEDEMQQAAEAIRRLGARSVLLKGGHLLESRKAESTGSLEEADAVDILDEEGRVTVFRAELVATGEFHGSGCTLSAAIAACLGKGMTLAASVRAAKDFVTDAMFRSPLLGHGSRPIFIQEKNEQ